MNSAIIEAIEKRLQVKPFPIHFVDDIDGTTRHTTLGVPPFGTLFKLLRRASLNPNEDRVRKAIELGGRTPEPVSHYDGEVDCDNEVISPFLLPLYLHFFRPVIPGSRESIEMIARAATSMNRQIRFENLSGREPDYHEFTRRDQYKDGLRKEGESLYLNPGVGSKNWKPYWIHSRLTGEDGRNPANVVLREDDLEATQLCAALNRLPEVQKIGTRVLVYWKQHRANPGILLWYAGVKLEQGVIPFRNHMLMAHDFIDRMRLGQI